MQNYMKLISDFQTIRKQYRILLTRHVARYNLSYAEAFFLLVLLEKDNVTQEYLGRRINSDKSCITRIIADMEKCGYIQRQQGHLDKRIKYVLLTSTGRELAATIQEHFNSLVNYFARQIGREPLDNAATIIHQVADLMNDVRFTNTSIK